MFIYRHYVNITKPKSLCINNYKYMYEKYKHKNKLLINH